MKSFTRTVNLRVVSARLRGPTLPLPMPAKPLALSPAAPVRLPGATGAAPAAIETAFRRLTVMIAIDDSGSTQPPSGTDPHFIRYAASRSVIEWMKRQGGGRAGVLHFGGEAPASLAVGPVPVNRRSRALNRALNVRPNLGWTAPAAALRRAAEMLPPPVPGEVVAVLLLTDGDPGDGLEAALALLPEGSVHVLVVGPGDQHAAWERLPFASLTPLPAFDNQELAWACGSVLAQALGLQLRPLPTTP